MIIAPLRAKLLTAYVFQYEQGQASGRFNCLSILDSAGMMKDGIKLGVPTLNLSSSVPDVANTFFPCFIFCYFCLVFSVS